MKAVKAVRRRWEDVLPNRLAWELSEMKQMAPELRWCTHQRAWYGLVPTWPFDREPPEQLDEFLAGDRLEAIIKPSAAHPAVPPKILPLKPQPTHEQCTYTIWHTLGDGSICVVREYYNWTGAESCAALIPTAAGWFLEYLLMTAGIIDNMTAYGIESSGELDDLLIPASRVKLP